ncbi:MAG: hypothetical protein ACK5MJ_08560 [Alphaproteobacteria bacterium]
MVKKISFSFTYGFFLLIWLGLFTLNRLYLVYYVDLKLQVVLALWGAIALLWLCLKQPLFLAFLIAYFILLWFYPLSPYIPMLPLLLWLGFGLYKAPILTLLTPCFTLIFMTILFFASYGYLTHKAHGKCIFVKNDGRFVVNSPINYAYMLQPIALNARIPTGALIILSSDKQPQKRWAFSAKGKIFEISKFSTTLANETQCKKSS